MQGLQYISEICKTTIIGMNLGVYECAGDEFGTKCASFAHGLDPEFGWEAEFLGV